MTEKPDIVERLRIPYTDRSCDDCDADRIDAAREIEQLRVYKAAMMVMANQYICPKMTAAELAVSILGEVE